jgi:2-dehydropantoate 2-reductase
MIGAGSLGLLFAGNCSKSHGEVELVTHLSEQCELLSRNGLKLWKDDHQHTAHLNCVSFDKLVYERLEKSGSTTIDWIFLFVKQQHLNPSLIRYLEYWASRGIPILCFQNGIGHIERLSQSIPVNLIYTAVTTEAAVRESPYQVNHTGKGETWIGHENPLYSLSSIQENNLIKYLKNAGFTVNPSKNIKSIVWKKLLINAVINPLTAILRVKNGELIESPYTRQLMKALYEEGRSVADSMGIELPEQLWEQLLAVCKATSMNTSSMLQDRLEGKTTEVEWINGAIIRIAEQRQLSVPTHQVIYRIIKGIESSSSFSCDN